MQKTTIQYEISTTEIVNICWSKKEQLNSKYLNLKTNIVVEYAYTVHKIGYMTI